MSDSKHHTDEFARFTRLAKAKEARPIDAINMARAGRRAMEAKQIQEKSKESQT